MPDVHSCAALRLEPGAAADVTAPLVRAARATTVEADVFPVTPAVGPAESVGFAESVERRSCAARPRARFVQPVAAASLTGADFHMWDAVGFAADRAIPTEADCFRSWPAASSS